MKKMLTGIQILYHDAKYAIGNSAAWRFYSELDDKRAKIYAAACAFFILLSLLPMTSLAVSLIPLTRLSEGDLMQFFVGVLPEELIGLISSLVRDVYEAGAGVFSLSLAGTLWSAGRGVYYLRCGLNRIYGLRETRGYLCRRLLASLYTLMLISLPVLLVVVILFGERAAVWLGGCLPEAANLLILLLGMRYPAMILLLSLSFALIYRLVPDRLRRRETVFPGAFCTALCWTIFTALFSLWLTRFGSSTFGSLAALAIPMIWLYAGVYLLFAGALLNLRLEERAAANRKK